MQGPMTAAMRTTRAPSACIAASVASSTPAAAPRQPAWAAPTTPASASANSTGAQSPVTMPSVDARPVGHHRIGARALAGRPGRGDADHLGAMHLRQADQAGRVGAEGAGGAGAVLQHIVPRVLARQAAVQAGERPRRDAAVAGEEPVRGGEGRGAQQRNGSGHEESLNCGGGRTEDRRPRVIRPFRRPMSAPDRPTPVELGDMGYAFGRQV